METEDSNTENRTFFFALVGFQLPSNFIHKAPIRPHFFLKRIDFRIQEDSVTCSFILLRWVLKKICDQENLTG